MDGQFDRQTDGVFPALATQDGQATLAKFLLARQADLDGFPVHVLLGQYLMALEQSESSVSRALTLARHALGSWLASLQTAIGQFPAQPIESLARQKEQLLAAHAALLALQQILCELDPALPGASIKRPKLFRRLPARSHSLHVGLEQAGEP